MAVVLIQTAESIGALESLLRALGDMPGLTALAVMLAALILAPSVVGFFAQWWHTRQLTAAIEAQTSQLAERQQQRAQADLKVATTLERLTGKVETVESILTKVRSVQDSHGNKLTRIEDRTIRNGKTA